MRQSKGKENALVWLPYLLISCIAFVTFYILNKKTVHLSDDYTCCFLFKSLDYYENPQRIATIDQIIESAGNYYQNLGGRVLSLVAALIILMFPKDVFDVINSGMFILLGWLVYFHVNRTKEHKPLLLLVVYMMLYVYIPDFALSSLWLSGATNYLWTINIVMLFLLFYRMEQTKEIVCKGYKKVVFFILVIVSGFITGISNENIGGAAAGLAALFSIYHFYKTHRIKTWQVVGIVSAFVGSAVLILAPGNRVRANSTVDTTVDYVKRIKNMLIITNRTCTVLVLFAVVFVVIATVLWKKAKKTGTDVMVNALCYCIAGAVSCSVLIASPYTADRSWLGTVLFLLVAVLSLADFCYETLEWKKKRYMALAVVIISLIPFSLFYKKEYDILDRNYHRYMAIEAQLIEQKEQGISDVLTVKYFDKFEVGHFSAYKATANIANASDDWLATINRWLAAYYDIHSYAIVTLPAEAETMEEK